MTAKVSWSIVLHTAAQGLVWVVPLFILAYPKIGDLTISAALSLIVGYVNHKFLANNS